MILAQAVESGLDLAKIVGIGAPSSIGTAILFWIGKMYLDSRKDKREEKKSDRESESGIVETTSALTKLVREQMIAMGSEIEALKMRNAAIERQYEIEIDKLKERIAGLEADNEQLRRQRFER